MNCRSIIQSIKHRKKELNQFTVNGIEFRQIGSDYVAQADGWMLYVHRVLDVYTWEAWQVHGLFEVSIHGIRNSFCSSPKTAAQWMIAEMIDNSWMVKDA